jgi:hypothetical protein
MRDISLHLLDLMQNSTAAGADRIMVRIKVGLDHSGLEIVIEDNGRGMSRELSEKVRDPFVTTRTTRRAGLGIPLYEAAALRAGGNFRIESAEGVGTMVTATFETGHIDRPPLGNIAETVVNMIAAYPEIELELQLESKKGKFIFNTSMVKKVLGEEVPITGNDVLAWIGEYIDEGVKMIMGGVLDEVDS